MPPLVRRSGEDDSSNDDDSNEESYRDMPLYVLRSVTEYDSSDSEYDPSDDEYTAATANLTEDGDNGYPAMQEDYNGFTFHLNEATQERLNNNW
eukprot:4634494-Ditylum_brightwellii.AAC.1